MAQVNSSSTPRPADAEHDFSCRAPASGAFRAPPSSQARYDFDAALSRAGNSEDHAAAEPDHGLDGASAARPQRPSRSESDKETDPNAQDPFGAPNPLMTLGGQLPVVPQAGVLMMAGAMPQQLPTPMSQNGLSAESRPGQSILGARQFSLSLPGEQAGSALTLRMTQASPTHWQLRLGADAATRQQLSPHVERLRERLRQRQGGSGHTADFDLEDDG